MLEIKNLTKKFNSRVILDDISLEVKPGEVAVLLGSSGVGKSTLLRILNNLETYNSGEILLNSKTIDIKNINKTHISGMVFQQFNLFENMSVERNITFALEKSLNKDAQEAKIIAGNLLKKYNLEDKADLPVTKISGGQKQRLAIARTLALKPKIVCLDEPTSALDPLLTSYVAKNIEELALENYIVLVATHDISLIERLNCTIYLMSQGKIVESANSKNFGANKEKFPLIKKFVEGNI